MERMAIVPSGLALLLFVVLSQLNSHTMVPSRESEEKKEFLSEENETYGALQSARVLPRSEMNEAIFMECSFSFYPSQTFTTIIDVSGSGREVLSRLRSVREMDWKVGMKVSARWTVKTVEMHVLRSAMGIRAWSSVSKRIPRSRPTVDLIVMEEMDKITVLLTPQVEPYRWKTAAIPTPGTTDSSWLSLLVLDLLTRSQSRSEDDYFQRSGRWVSTWRPERSASRTNNLTSIHADILRQYVAASCCLPKPVLNFLGERTTSYQGRVSLEGKKVVAQVAREAAQACGRIRAC